MLPLIREKDSCEDCPPNSKFAIRGRFGIPDGEQSSKLIESTADSPRLMVDRSSETSNFGSAQAGITVNSIIQSSARPWQPRPNRRVRSH